MANVKHIEIDGTTYDVIPSGSYVTGVKGSAESDYRTGNVNLSKTNVGLGNVPNVTTNNQTPTFAQASTRANIASGEKLSVLFGKIMKFFADLKTVAFSGSYNDLSDKPTIPTVNNATLTIQKNGTNVQTFTANASANKTANITVPTKVSELTNDSGFIGGSVSRANSTLNTTYVQSGTNCLVEKMGKTAHLSDVSFLTKASSTNNNVVATIPSGYRPNTAIAGVAVYSNSTSYYSAVTINTNGQIVVAQGLLNDWIKIIANPWTVA